jgi:hypothetical protein
MGPHAASHPINGSLLPVSPGPEYATNGIAGEHV